MRLRGLRESDHETVVSVVDEWWGGRRVAEKLPRLFFRYFQGTSFAVEEEGALIAFLVGFVGSPSEEAYIHFAGVRPGHRGCGIGRRLYEAFFDEARRRGCLRVRCITSPANEVSREFHARMGFGVVEGDAQAGGVAVHPDYDGKDKVVFEKELF